MSDGMANKLVLGSMLSLVILMMDGISGAESAWRLLQSKAEWVRHGFFHMVFAFQRGYAVMATCYVS